MQVDIIADAQAIANMQLGTSEAPVDRTEDPDSD